MLDDLHVLVLEPISLEEGNLSPADHQLHPFDTNILSLSTAVSNLHLEGENSLFDVIEHATDDFSASSSSTLMLDRPNAPGPVLLPKLEENQSSIPVKAEMYPPLPSPPEPAAAVTTPLPHGPVLINGIYYQSIPAPHTLWWCNLQSQRQQSFPAPKKRRLQPSLLSSNQPIQLPQHHFRSIFTSEASNMLGIGNARDAIPPRSLGKA